MNSVIRVTCAMFAVSSFACGAYSEPVVYPAPPDPGPPVAAAPDADAQAQSPEIQIGVNGDEYADTDPSALTEFKPALDPHGSWVDDPTYGTVWAPNAEEVGADFTPYVTAGHWAYGDDYVWVSDYQWGWAPFHYGRWVSLSGGGWGWIPGRVYSGAWVDWRVGDGGYAYVGWAPRPPLWGWRGGRPVGFGVPVRASFVYVPHGEIFEPRVGAHLVVGERVGEVAAHTRPYVVASPTPSNHPFGQPSMHGPAPASLGIEASHVTHPMPTNHSVVRAQQYAKPSVAQPLGARPPTAHVVRQAPPPPRPSAPRQAPRGSVKRH